MAPEKVGLFIAHIVEDKKRVRKLNKKLQDNGIHTWMDERELRPGQVWDQAILKAMENATAALVCLSRESVNKPSYYQREIKCLLTRQREQPEGKTFLIPVLLEPCDVPEAFKELQPARTYAKRGYEKLLSSLEDLDVKKPVPTDVPPAYLQYIKNTFGHVEPIMQTSKPLVARLQQIYVPLDIMSPGDRETEVHGFQTPGYSRIYLSDFIHLKAGHQVLIYGPPGCGKSTFLRHTALNEPEHLQPRLPVFVPLKTFGQWINTRAGEKPDLLVEWAAGEAVDQGLDDLPQRAGHGNLIWLLDGLDEIFQIRLRQRAAEIIRAYIRSTQFGKDAIIVTSRPHAFTQKGFLSTLGLESSLHEVQPLPPDRQRLFLEKWFKAIYGPEGKEKAEDLLNDLWQSFERHHELSKLRGNPLLLTIIATIYQVGKRLPEQRAMLYDQAVLALLQSRFGPDRGGSDQLVRELRQGLMSVARGMMERNEVEEIGETEFLELLEKGMFERRKPTAEDKCMLEERANELGCHSGLLAVDGNPARFRFLHLGFQEFLAARSYALERDPYRQLKKKVSSSAWREVVLLTSSYLLDNGPAWQSDDFLNALASEKTPGLALAVIAAAEAPAGTLNDSLKDYLVQRALDVIADPKSATSASERAQIGLSLGRLGDPRLGFNNPERWVRIKAGSFMMGSMELDPELSDRVRYCVQPVYPVAITDDFYLARYPVTNQEFKPFINDGGYEKETWWSSAGWTWRTLEGKNFEVWYAEQDVPDEYKEIWKDFFRPDDEPKYKGDTRFNAPNQPVVGVNWFEAEAWCNWLTARFQEDGPSWWRQGMRVLLPTEAQWEFAARGNTSRDYPWIIGKLTTEHANYSDSGIRTTTPVGIYPKGATPEGVCDMMGNVWEWCVDGWNERAYESRVRGVSDPFVPSETSARRAVRGGAWFFYARFLDPAFRSWSGAGNRFSDLGFRCCVSVPSNHRDTSS